MVDSTPTNTLQNWNLELHHYDNLKYQVNPTLQDGTYSDHFLCTKWFQLNIKPRYSQLANKLIPWSTALLEKLTVL